MKKAVEYEELELPSCAIYDTHEWFKLKSWLKSVVVGLYVQRHIMQLFDFAICKLHEMSHRPVSTLTAGPLFPNSIFP